MKLTGVTYAKSIENEETDVFIGCARFIQHGATRLVYIFGVALGLLLLLLHSNKVCSQAKGSVRQTVFHPTCRTQLSMLTCECLASIYITMFFTQVRMTALFTHQWNFWKPLWLILKYRWNDGSNVDEMRNWNNQINCFWDILTQTLYSTLIGSEGTTIYWIYSLAVGMAALKVMSINHFGQISNCGP